MGAPPPRDRMLRAASITLAALLVAGLGFLLVSRARAGAQRDELRAKLEAQVEAYRRERWTRPVHRGEPLEGNAADAQFAAVAALAIPDEHFDDVSGKLARGEAPPAALVALAREKAAQLADLRASARRTWTYTALDIQRAITGTAPDYAAALRAQKLLLVSATQVDGAECLRIGADTIRLAQDLGPGGMLLGHMVATAGQRVAASAIVRCAARATPADRAAAAAELVLLAEHHPPLGRALDAEALALAAHFAGMIDGAAAVPGTGVVGRVRRFIKHRELVDAWAALVHEHGSWAAIDEAPLPERLGRIRALGAARLAHDNEWLDSTAGDFVAFATRDLEGQALVRAAAVALFATARDPIADPPERQDPRLADPFSGSPLKWRAATGTAPAAVYSVGANGRDDSGDPSSDDLRIELP